jgi:glucose-6-phosphate 1-epimerase
VVWNPWIAKAAKMPDFGDEEWPGMLCVEAANAGEHRVTLPPGEAHVITQTISVAR